MPNFVKFAFPSVAAITVAFYVGQYVGSNGDAQAQKLDRFEFERYVSKTRQQYLVDSVNNSNQWQAYRDQAQQDRKRWMRILCRLYQECE